MNITEEQIHNAINFLTYKAPEKMANAKEHRIIQENMVKSVFSELFLSYDEGSIAEKEARARCETGHKEAVEVYAEAVRNEELIKRQIDAAQMKIEIWRTDAANNRSMKV